MKILILIHTFFTRTLFIIEVIHNGSIIIGVDLVAIDKTCLINHYNYQCFWYYFFIINKIMAKPQPERGSVILSLFV